MSIHRSFCGCWRRRSRHDVSDVVRRPGRPPPMAKMASVPIGQPACCLRRRFSSHCRCATTPSRSPRRTPARAERERNSASRQRENGCSLRTAHVTNARPVGRAARRDRAHRYRLHPPWRRAWTLPPARGRSVHAPGRAPAYRGPAAPPAPPSSRPTRWRPPDPVEPPDPAEPGGPLWTGTVQPGSRRRRRRPDWPARRKPDPGGPPVRKPQTACADRRAVLTILSSASV